MLPIVLAYPLWLSLAAPTLEWNQAVAAVKSVGPEAKNHLAAQAAWPVLANADAEGLLALLASLDDASPLAANWIYAAVDTVVERSATGEGRLPLDAIETFVFDRKHAPAARRRAYEILVAARPESADRILPQMLDDASLEMRRDAVARLIDQSGRLAGESKKEPAIGLLRRALVAARDVDQIRDVARRLTTLGETVDLARQLGFVMHWQVIGPFDNTAGRGFATSYSPEADIRLDAACEGKHGPVRWKPCEATGELCVVDLNRALVEEKSVCGYALAEVRSPTAQAVEIRLTSFNAVKVWLNGRLIDEHAVYHGGSQLDQYRSRATLEPGVNRLLVKVCQNNQTQDWAKPWQFQLRLCDALGAAAAFECLPVRAKTDSSKGAQP